MATPTLPSAAAAAPAVGADEVRVQVLWVRRAGPSRAHRKFRDGPVELINKSECTFAAATSFRIVKLSFFGATGAVAEGRGTIFCSSADLTPIFNAETGASGQEESSSELRREQQQQVHATMDVATFRSTFTRVAGMRDTLAAWQSAGRLTLVLDYGALTEELAFLDKLDAGALRVKVVLLSEGTTTVTAHHAQDSASKGDPIRCTMERDCAYFADATTFTAVYGAIRPHERLPPSSRGTVVSTWVAPTSLVPSGTLDEFASNFVLVNDPEVTLATADLVSGETTIAITRFQSDTAEQLGCKDPPADTRPLSRRMHLQRRLLEPRVPPAVGYFPDSDRSQQLLPLFEALRVDGLRRLACCTKGWAKTLDTYRSTEPAKITVHASTASVFRIHRMVEFLARKYPRARELGCMSLQLLPAADLPLLVQRFTSLQKLECDLNFERAETPYGVPRAHVAALRALVQAAPQLRALHLESSEKVEGTVVDESKSTDAGDARWASLVTMAEACPRLERLTWRYPSIQKHPNLPSAFTGVLSPEMLAQVERTRLVYRERVWQRNKS